MVYAHCCSSWAPLTSDCGFLKELHPNNYLYKTKSVNKNICSSEKIQKVLLNLKCLFTTESLLLVQHWTF